MKRSTQENFETKTTRQEVSRLSAFYDWNRDCWMVHVIRHNHQNTTIDGSEIMPDAYTPDHTSEWIDALIGEAAEHLGFELVSYDVVETQPEWNRGEWVNRDRETEAAYDRMF